MKIGFSDRGKDKQPFVIEGRLGEGSIGKGSMGTHEFRVLGLSGLHLRSSI